MPTDCNAVCQLIRVSLPKNRADALLEVCGLANVAERLCACATHCVVRRNVSAATAVQLEGLLGYHEPLENDIGVALAVRSCHNLVQVKSLIYANLDVCGLIQAFVGDASHGQKREIESLRATIESGTAEAVRLLDQMINQNSKIWFALKKHVGLSMSEAKVSAEMAASQGLVNNGLAQQSHYEAVYVQVDQEAVRQLELAYHMRGGNSQNVAASLGPSFGHLVKDVSRALRPCPRTCRQLPNQHGDDEDGGELSFLSRAAAEVATLLTSDPLQEKLYKVRDIATFISGKLREERDSPTLVRGANESQRASFIDVAEFLKLFQTMECGHVSSTSNGTLVPSKGNIELQAETIGYIALAHLWTLQVAYIRPVSTQSSLLHICNLTFSSQCVS